ncbi:MAG: branched-chain amino acid ABC transporter permease [Candidatus Heimdallarchaeota archaeon]|nr:branched-chain amino acid ABC transporter permease [Candidatus Heimdallarchaeota archaeon]MDH5645408.1 branched-chain amino acid ABC transporter permease [Candidatus Heimdallarchaeota archaeon]
MSTNKSNTTNDTMKKIKDRISEVNWSYHWDRIKDKGGYIVFVLTFIFIKQIPYLPIIGNLIQDAQNRNIIPNIETLNSLFIHMVILLIFIVSWDLLSGYSGQVSFGHGFFLGLGSYFTVYYINGLTVNGRALFDGKSENFINIGFTTIDLNVFTAILVGATVSAIISILIGLITLRLKGTYFALITLILPLIALNLAKNLWEEYTGGDLGLQTRRLVKQEDKELSQIVWEEYYFYLIIMFISIGIMFWIAKSRFGLALQSIREDELAAKASGINVRLYKLFAMGVSAFFAGIAGGLMVQSVGSPIGVVNVGAFETQTSFTPVIYTILGGIGTISGPIMGTIILTIAIYYLALGLIQYPMIELRAIAIILILILRFQPRGLIKADKQLKNGLYIGIFMAILISFVEELVNLPQLLATWFDDEGIFGLDILNIKGRLIFYFFINTIIGYFAPDFIRWARLKTWGVWPSLPDFDPPK